MKEIFKKSEIIATIWTLALSLSLYLFTTSCRNSPSPDQLKFRETMSMASELSNLLKDGFTMPSDDNDLTAMYKTFTSESLARKAKKMHDDELIFITRSSHGKKSILIKSNGYDGYEYAFIFINKEGRIGPVYMSKSILDADLRL